MRTKLKNKIPLCACDCGNPVEWNEWNKRWNKFIYRHPNRKGMPSPLKGRKRPIEVKLKISKALTGNTLSSETKEKLRQINIGKKLSEKTKTKIGKAHKGKTTSDETKLKMSLASFGKKNGAWRGGITYEPYCEAWLDKEYKRSIKDRDNNECQNPNCWHSCDHLPLTIHHIDYDKKNCVPKNLLTLCCSCNARANTNREEWKMFYQKIIEQKHI